jgi:hypothetical protein
MLIKNTKVAENLKYATFCQTQKVARVPLIGVRDVSLFFLFSSA